MEIKKREQDKLNLKGRSACQIKFRRKVESHQFFYLFIYLDNVSASSAEPCSRWFPKKMNPINA